MAIVFNETELPGVYEIVPDRFGDSRGYFSEVFKKEAFEDQGIFIDWVQDNQSLSAEKGVLRGLHYQRPPVAQDKLVRVVRGAILDVAVDIRSGSPTYKKWVACTLTADKGNQLLVPKGFAHGFLTLEPNTEVLYKVSDRYSPDHDASIRFDDPEISVDWQLEGAAPVLSQKDAHALPLAAHDTGFTYVPGDTAK